MKAGRTRPGHPITASFTTGYFRVGDGEDICFVDQIIPDMRWGLYGGDQDASLTLTFYSQNSPSDTPRT